MTLQAADHRDDSLLELAQETDRLAANVVDPAICTRLHEIAYELLEWACAEAD
jgi:hypothetical protein